MRLWRKVLISSAIGLSTCASLNYIIYCHDTAIGDAVMDKIGSVQNHLTVCEHDDLQGLDAGLGDIQKDYAALTEMHRDVSRLWSGSLSGASELRSSLDKLIDMNLSNIDMHLVRNHRIILYRI